MHNSQPDKRNPTDQIRISVIIPFFQRSPGLLATCLTSIANQRVPSGTYIAVTVVDDDSPVSPAVDIAATELSAAMSVEVIRQANAGPAAARNRGLDAVTAETDFIAFVDSDDYWEPDHIGDAIRALADDADFYFCDSEVEPGLTEFEQLPILAAPDDSDLFAIVPGQPDVFEFKLGDAALQMTQEYLAHTSTIVYRWRPMADLRFEPMLRYAGEDHLMWVRIASRSRKVRFSRAVNSVRGHGVNLYRSALDRLSGSNIRREACRARAFQLIADEPGLAPAASALADKRRQLQVREVAAILLHPPGFRAALEPETRSALRLFLAPFWRKLPMLWGGVLIDRMRTKRSSARAPVR